MTEKRTIECKIAPHLQGEEVQKRLATAVERRNQADFECFQLLREMADHGLLDAGRLTKSFLLLGEELKEAENNAQHYANEVLMKLRERRQADMEFAHIFRGTKPQ